MSIEERLRKFAVVNRMILEVVERIRDFGGKIECVSAFYGRKSV
jgi:hypothetical protein